MNKLFIFCLIFSISAARAELCYDPQTDKSYSKGAAKNVNQQEYHDLCVLTFTYAVSLTNVTKEQRIASMFALLRTIGTPAALRLIEDLKQIIKQGKADQKWLKNL